MPRAAKRNPILSGNPRLAIEKVEAEAKAFHERDCTGHDWFHIDRVRNNALWIAEAEGGDKFVVEVAALLHDIGDPKLKSPDNYYDPDEIMHLADIDRYLRERIIRVIESVGYKGGNAPEPSTLEAQIVQDADRLDAIGAIGIARAFAYGGSKARPIWCPDDVVETSYATSADYYAARKSSITHFHEKLLRIKDMLHTNAARIAAEPRHEHMVKYVEQFMLEWNGEI